MTKYGVLETVVALGLLVGFSFAFWALVSLLRLFLDSVCGPRSVRGTRPAGENPTSLLNGFNGPVTHQIRPSDVAVVIPARNEEVGLPNCIEALLRLVAPSQIFVASDGSSDGTVQIAQALGCNVSDIQPNRGKARALQHVIDAWALCDKFKAVLICDADSQIDPDYLKHALPLFDDPAVATVACHQLSTWRLDWFPNRGQLASIRGLSSMAELLGRMKKLLFTAYRVRLFRMMQSVYQYGQSWRPFDVSYIAPGAGSIYRTSALRQINITAPNLVIEDFNMTFEVHHKRLGRVAYVPGAKLASEDPFTFEDYCKQIRRWYLGFWQTIWRHGLWPSKFCVALVLFSIEVLAFSIFLVALPVLAVLHATVGLGTYSISAGTLGIVEVSPYSLILTYLAIDLASTIIVAAYERRPEILVFAPIFPIIRYVDAVVYLRSFIGSFKSTSDGSWRSPTRQLA